MQRIGRVDCRLDPEIEAQMIADHPELAKARGTARLWDFFAAWRTEPPCAVSG